jgi:ATP-dependent DNA ligase
VTLRVRPPVSPMLAKLAREMPVGDEWSYEPKWDGFRCIVFRDGDEIELGSRNERPLTRYFPDLVGPLLAALPDGAVVDGEIVIKTPAGLDFDLLSLRIHPAASRVAVLAEATPASFVAFDLLADAEQDRREQPFEERRAALEAMLASAGAPIHLTPITRDPARAHEWFETFEGAGLDGVVAKKRTGEYKEGERGWLKVKHLRTADCVVAGFRWHKDGKGVGSLLLGLFDGSGTLQHVGVASSFNAVRRKELVEEIAAYRTDGLDGHPWAEWGGAAAETDEEGASRMPGAPSRWNAKKDMTWEPLRIGLVAEVAYEHMQRDRFRHTTRFQRWRPDRQPSSCTYEQLEVPVPMELEQVFGS